MLLNMASKVFCRVILERTKIAQNEKLREDQAGFQAGRSCSDQIATMRIIVEQTIEWQSFVYQLYRFRKRPSIVPAGRFCISSEVDAALRDSCQGGHQSSSWRFFRTGGTQWADDSTIEYEGWGKTRLPTISLAVSGCPGLGGEDSLWPEERYSVDLYDILRSHWLCDDLALLSRRIQDMRDKTRALEVQGAKVGLKINATKTKLLRLCCILYDVDYDVD